MPLLVIFDDPSEAEATPASIIAYGTVGKENYKPSLATVLLKRKSHLLILVTWEFLSSHLSEL